MLSLPPSAQHIKGDIITPDHAGYEQARAVFMGAIDRRPAMVVRAVDAQYAGFLDDEGEQRVRAAY